VGWNRQSFPSAVRASGAASCLRGDVVLRHSTVPTERRRSSDLLSFPRRPRSGIVTPTTDKLPNGPRSGIIAPRKMRELSASGEASLSPTGLSLLCPATALLSNAPAEGPYASDDPPWGRSPRRGKQISDHTRVEGAPRHVKLARASSRTVRWACCVHHAPRTLGRRTAGRPGFPERIPAGADPNATRGGRVA
jgi:hypothetical protein